jgi:hypothetical protein
MSDTTEHAELVTRVEIITEKGREYVNMNCSDVQILRQDNSRTLKIFLRNGATTPSA